MRKPVIMVCCIVFCFLIIGCGAKEKQKVEQRTVTDATESIKESFESNLTIQYGELAAEATFVRTSPGLCRLSVTSPEELAGTELVFEQDKVTLTYLGMTMSVDPSSVPGTAVIKLLTGAVDSVLQEEGVTLSYEDSVLLLEGQVGTSGNFTLRVDSETGNLLSLSVPDEALEVSFRDFKFLS